MSLDITKKVTGITYNGTVFPIQGGGIEVPDGYGIMTIDEMTVRIKYSNNMYINHVLQPYLVFSHPFENSNSFAINETSETELKFDSTLLGITSLPNIVINNPMSLSFRFPWSYGDVQLNFIIWGKPITEAELNEYFQCQYNYPS